MAVSKSSQLTQHSGTDRNASRGTRTSSKRDNSTSRRSSSGERSSKRDQSSARSEESLRKSEQVQTGLVDSTEVTRGYLKRSKSRGAAAEVATAEDYVVRVTFAIPLGEGLGSPITAL
ncbi:MAG: hypothetical protein ACOYMN_24485 [Roseimicrobium sp.]